MGICYTQPHPLCTTAAGFTRAVWRAGDSTPYLITTFVF